MPERRVAGAGFGPHSFWADTRPSPNAACRLGEKSRFCPASFVHLQDAMYLLLRTISDHDLARLHRFTFCP